MAHDTPLRQHLLDLGHPWHGNGHGGRRRHGRGRRPWRRPQPDDDAQDHHHPHQCIRPGVWVAAQLEPVAHHEELADQRPGEHHQNEHHPVLRVGIGEAVVVAEHGKQHRQREVGVVHAALFGALAVDRVHRSALAQVLHRGALPRDDPEEHIGAHAGGDHRAHQQERRAPGEPVAGQPGSQAHHQKDQCPHDRIAVPALSECLADQVVDDPEHREKRHSHTDGRATGPVHQGFVDQVGAGAPQVGHREQRKPGQPGAVGLPVEPVQVLRHHTRCHGVLLRVVEPSPMDGPQLATHPQVLQVLRSRLDQTAVEEDEIERGSDPGDGGDDMHPAQQQIGPVKVIRFHASHPSQSINQRGVHASRPRMSWAATARAITAGSLPGMPDRPIGQVTRSTSSAEKPRSCRRCRKVAHFVALPIRPI